MYYSYYFLYCTVSLLLNGRFCSPDVWLLGCDLVRDGILRECCENAEEFWHILEGFVDFHENLNAKNKICGWKYHSYTFWESGKSHTYISMERIPYPQCGKYKINFPQYGKQDFKFIRINVKCEQ